VTLRQPDSLVHSFEETSPHQRGNRRSRNAFVLVAACLAASTAGCSHINAMFDDPARAPKPAVVKSVPAPKPAPVVTPAQRAEAKALRTTALAQIRRGAIGPAISNLKRAAKLDPENRQVRRDIAWATSLRSATVASARQDINPPVD
jgi:hypothetical protein